MAWPFSLTLVHGLQWLCFCKTDSRWHWKSIEVISRCMGANSMGEASVDETKDAYRHAKMEYDQIKSEHEAVVSQRKDALKEAKKSQKKTIASLNSQMAKLENDLHGRVAKVGGVSLYHDRLEVDGTTYKLEHGLRVTVFTSGSKYATTNVSGGGASIGGAVVGAAIAGVPGAIIGGRKKVKSKEVVHDERHLYVSVESPQGGQVADLNPDLEEQARSLAAQVPGCINLYQGLSQDIPPKIEALKAKVAEAEKDAAVSAAEAELERAVNDTERLEAAKQVRDETKQLYHDEKKQHRSPFFGSHAHGGQDDGEEAEEACDRTPVSRTEQEHPGVPAQAGSGQKRKSLSVILWKILGVLAIVFGIFFLLGMLGGVLDGYEISFNLVCLVLGCGLVYLGIRLMRHGKTELKPQDSAGD